MEGRVDVRRVDGRKGGCEKGDKRKKIERS